MSEPVSSDPYKGVRDFYPADWAALELMFANIRQTLELWGYEEYNASPLERAELYEAKTSEEIVNEQTYTFTDRGNRRVTLRPEMTPTLARMIAAKRRDLVFPLRWFSIGNRFRYERPQKGRLREFYQVDIDLIGLPEGEADIEIIRLATEILRTFGAKDHDFVVRINSRSLLNSACQAAGLKGDGLRQYLRLLDKKSKMTAQAFAAASSSLSVKDPLSFIEPSGMDSFITTLKGRGVNNVVFDPSIIRGFDYYTGVIFEVYDTSSSNPRSIFGGGRYDALINLFGTTPIPAVGFALGDVTLADFLKTHSLIQKENSFKPRLYLATPSTEDIPKAQVYAETLRKEGVRVFVNITQRSLSDQVKDAVKRSIPFFVAYGPDEIANQIVRMKILATGEEISIALPELPKHLLAS